MDSQLKINDQLTINYQSDFHLLDEEEKRTMPLTGGGPVEVLRDQERHMIVSIGCKKIPGLASMLFNQNDAVKQLKKDIRKSMAVYGFRNEKDLNRSIADENAQGLCYEYDAQGIAMYAQSYVFKHGKELFYFHFYSRTELKESNLMIWHELLDSARF